MTTYAADPEAYVDDVITAATPLDFAPSVVADSHPALVFDATWQGAVATTRTLRTLVGNKGLPAGTLITRVRLVNPNGNDIALDDIYLA